MAARSSSVPFVINVRTITTEGQFAGIYRKRRHFHMAAEVGAAPLGLSNYPPDNSHWLLQFFNRHAEAQAMPLGAGFLSRWRTRSDLM